MISKALIGLALASSAMAGVLPGVSVIPSAFKALGAAPDSHPVSFTLHLAEADPAGLDARLEQIATSGGAWLTPDELAQYVTPKPETSAAVKSFLASAGIADSAVQYSANAETATVTTDAATLKKLFPGTQFNLFSYLSNSLVRTKQLVVPDAIASAVTHVGGLLDFQAVKHLAPAERRRAPEPTALAKRADASKCDPSHVTPDCLRTYYGDYSYQVNTAVRDQVDITVMGYIGQYVSQKDLTTFLQKYRPDAAGYQIPIQTVLGGTNDPNNPGIEAMLDVETVVSHAYPLNVNFVSLGPANDANDIFAQTFDYLAGAGSARPNVVTISYGADEKGMSASAAAAMCNSAKKLTALGTTIVISSGDSGVDGSGITNGDVCLGTPLAPFLPTYPGGCPYVSSIGATQNFAPEIMVSDTLPAVDGFFSGAGRSNFFPIPSFQASQVAAYDASIGANLLQVPPGSYNKSGRAFPDYAACGMNYAVIVNGTEELVGGTSASAPTTASVFGLVNNALKAAGKPTLGWSQPKLYPLEKSAFNDITSGGSYGCALSSSLTPIGFPAGTGFDGASGIGSPQFQNIRAGLGA